MKTMQVFLYFDVMKFDGNLTGTTPRFGDVKIPLFIVGGINLY